MRPVYNKAIVSVNDHVECRCQPAPRPASRRKSPAHKQEARDRSGKPRYKDELHRRDELKTNQRLKLEDLLSNSWLPLESGQDAWNHNKTHHGKSRSPSLGDGRKYNHSSNGTYGSSSEKVTNPLPNHIKREDTGLLLHNVTRARDSVREKEAKDVEIQKNRTINDDRLTNQSLVNGVSAPEITNQILQHESALIQCAGHSKRAESSQAHRNETTSQMETKQNPSEAHVGQTSQTVVPKPAEKTYQTQSHAFYLEKEPSTRIKENETPESGSTQEETRSRTTLLKERKALEEEKEELLLLHKRLDEEKHKHILKTQQHSQQEDQKQHHKPQQTHTTTQRTGKNTQT